MRWRAVAASASSTSCWIRNSSVAPTGNRCCMVLKFYQGRGPEPSRTSPHELGAGRAIFGSILRRAAAAPPSHRISRSFSSPVTVPARNRTGARAGHTAERSGSPQAAAFKPAHRRTDRFRVSENSRWLSLGGRDLPPQFDRQAAPARWKDGPTCPTAESNAAPSQSHHCLSLG